MKRVVLQPSGDGGKLQNIVILRAFAIIAVVLYHCFCPWLHAWNWIETSWRPVYSYIFEGVMVGRMPLFICVSGYLFSYLYNEKGKYATFMGLLQNKTKRLLLPCFLFTIIICLTFHCNVLEHFFFYGGHLWFLKMLYLCFIVSWVLGRYAKGKWQYLCLILTALMMFAPDIKFFAIGQFTKYFVFFYAGFLLCKNREVMKPFFETKNALVFHAIVYLNLCIILAYLYLNNRNLASGDIIHQDANVKYLLVLMRGYTIIFAFSLVNYIVSSRKTICRFFDRINDCSYGIYLLHFYLIDCIKKFAFEDFIKLTNLPPFIAPLLVFGIIFSLSYGLTYLFKKTKIGRYLL